jgi:hypothetical protein
VQGSDKNLQSDQVAHMVREIRKKLRATSMQVADIKEKNEKN